MLRLFILLTAIMITSYVGAATQAAIDLKQHLDACSSMKANFKQVVISSTDKPLQQSSGSMVLKRPGFFRWYTHQPNRQIIVVNDEKAWIYDIDLAQLTINHLDLQEDSALAILLSHSKGNFDQRYQIRKKVSSSKKAVYFTLIPKSEHDHFTWIKFLFYDKQLVGMDFKDKMGQISKIKFSNIVLNKKINENIFKINPPKDVDIINNTPSIRN